MSIRVIPMWKAGGPDCRTGINDVLNGPNGKDVVIIVTYDENGGFWDLCRSAGNR